MIKFNVPYLTGREEKYFQQCLQQKSLIGDGFFTKKVCGFLEKKCNYKKVLLTPSCTAALEMAALVLGLKKGDEVIVPSYTFVSTANAFILQGIKPVFVDIKLETVNMDESKVEKLITKKTKAIVVVHYGGVSCHMQEILKIAKRHNLYVIEDAAQGICAKYKEKYLGSIGDIGCISFHGTKNIVCGEGGALVLNKKKYIKRAEIIREKGTNRSKFLREEVDKYTWIDRGSSYLLSEINASFLYAQIKEMANITRQRLKIWDQYYNKLINYSEKVHILKPPQDCYHNAHLFFLIFKSTILRDNFIRHMKNEKIHCTTHYEPLHLSPYSKKNKFKNGELKTTSFVHNGLVRLPIYPGVNFKRVIDASERFLKLI